MAKDLSKLEAMITPELVKKWKPKIKKAFNALMNEDGYDLKYENIEAVLYSDLNKNSMCFPKTACIDMDKKKIIVDPRYGEKERVIGLNHELIHYEVEERSDFRKHTKMDKALIKYDTLVDKLACALYDAGVGWDLYEEPKKAEVAYAYN